jgi:sugar transferase (PEP-CTERM/EpsH1 system associated)
MKLQPLVLHLVYRLDFGGLETLLVECVNRMPAEKFRHVIVCLTDFSDFSKRISRHDVEIFSLQKQPGWGVKSHADFWRLCKKLKPQILHTYNLPTIEYSFTGFFAGVPIRIHAEHGRDINDPEGKIWKYKVLRKILKPFIDYFVPVSIELKDWLTTVVGVPQRKIRLINNGVDLRRFQFKTAASDNFLWTEKSLTDCFVIGTVGRIQEVKNHAALIDAFVLLRENFPEMRD